MTGIDLSKYTLCLPMDANGKLSGDAVYGIDPVEYMHKHWDSEYFRYDGNSKELIIRTPADGGAVTKSAKYPRTELCDKRRFTHLQVCKDKTTFKIMEVPKGEKICIQQLHNGDFPWSKVEWKDGILLAYIKHDDFKGAKDEPILISDGLELGTQFTHELSYHPALYNESGAIIYSAYIKSSLNDNLFKTFDVSHKGGNLRVQKGLYPQMNDCAGQWCEVRHVLGDV